MEKNCSPSEFLRLAKERQAAGGISAIRQCLELSILLPFYGVGPGFYQMAGFWKKGTPWSSKKGHLSPSAYRSAVGKLNPAPYRKISQNKLSETAIFRLFRIPSPAYIGFYNNLSGKDADGHELSSLEQFSQLLKKFEHGAKICFKPLEGWAGHGFEAAEITKQEGSVQLIREKTNSKLSPAEFRNEIILKQHKGSSIIEEYLEQHPALAEFNPSSVNTMRLWVIDRLTGEPELVLGYLRIGRQGSLVDNQSSGGIVAPIELDTGKLKCATDGLYNHKIFNKHPDHGAQIEGQNIPFFTESIALAKQVLTVFPGTGFAGVDVAIASDGPRIIELNLSPDREGAAFVGIPSSTVFNR